MAAKLKSLSTASIHTIDGFVAEVKTSPGAPSVAPLTGNSVKEALPVIPLVPPFILIDGDPAVIATKPPEPPPPGPSASLPVIS